MKFYENNKVLERYLDEMRATDTSSGTHGPEGYPEADVPSKLLMSIGSALHGGGKDILKIWKGEGHWTFQVASRNFDVRHGDFKKLVKLGLNGVRYEAPNSMLLYFKQ